MVRLDFLAMHLHIYFGTSSVSLSSFFIRDMLMYDQICIRTDLFCEIRARRMRIFLGFVASLVPTICDRFIMCNDELMRLTYFQYFSFDTSTYSLSLFDAPGTEPFALEKTDIHPHKQYCTGLLDKLGQLSKSTVSHNNHKTQKYKTLTTNTRTQYDDKICKKQ